jgi:mannose-6-phosphate isomerase-like protein (cupin superfamily)
MIIVSLQQLAEEAASHNPRIRKKVFVRNGEIPHLTGFSRAVFPPGSVTDTHTHPDMFEVFLVESGSGRLKGRGDGDVPLAGGQCVIVSPGEEHELENTGEEDLVLVYLGIEVQGPR